MYLLNITPSILKDVANLERRNYNKEFQLGYEDYLSDYELYSNNELSNDYFSYALYDNKELNGYIISHRLDYTDYDNEKVLLSVLNKLHDNIDRLELFNDISLKVFPWLEEIILSPSFYNLLKTNKVEILFNKIVEFSKTNTFIRNVKDSYSRYGFETSEYNFLFGEKFFDNATASSRSFSKEESIKCIWLTENIELVNCFKYIYDFVNKKNLIYISDLNCTKPKSLYKLLFSYASILHFNQFYYVNGGEYIFSNNKFLNKMTTVSNYPYLYNNFQAECRLNSYKLIKKLEKKGFVTVLYETILEQYFGEEDAYEIVFSINYKNISLTLVKDLKFTFEIYTLIHDFVNFDVIKKNFLYNNINKELSTCKGMNNNFNKFIDQFITMYFTLNSYSYSTFLNTIFNFEKCNYVSLKEVKNIDKYLMPNKMHLDIVLETVYNFIVEEQEFIYNTIYKNSMVLNHTDEKLLILNCDEIKPTNNYLKTFFKRFNKPAFTIDRSIFKEINTQLYYALEYDKNDAICNEAESLYFTNQIRSNMIKSYIKNTTEFCKPLMKSNPYNTFKSISNIKEYFSEVLNINEFESFKLLPVYSEISNSYKYLIDYLIKMYDYNFVIYSEQENSIKIAELEANLVSFFVNIVNHNIDKTKQFIKNDSILSCFVLEEEFDPRGDLIDLMKNYFETIHSLPNKTKKTKQKSSTLLLFKDKLNLILCHSSNILCYFKAINDANYPNGFPSIPLLDSFVDETNIYSIQEMKNLFDSKNPFLKANKLFPTSVSHISVSNMVSFKISNLPNSISNPFLLTLKLFHYVETISTYTIVKGIPFCINNSYHEYIQDLSDFLYNKVFFSIQEYANKTNSNNEFLSVYVSKAKNLYSDRFDKARIFIFKLFKMKYNDKPGKYRNEFVRTLKYFDRYYYIHRFVILDSNGHICTKFNHSDNYGTKLNTSNVYKLKDSLLMYFNKNIVEQYKNFNNYLYLFYTAYILRISDFTKLTSSILENLGMDEENIYKFNKILLSCNYELRGLNDYDLLLGNCKNICKDISVNSENVLNSKCFSFDTESFYQTNMLASSSYGLTFKCQNNLREGNSLLNINGVPAVNTSTNFSVWKNYEYILNKLFNLCTNCNIKLNNDIKYIFAEALHSTLSKTVSIASSDNSKLIENSIFHLSKSMTNKETFKYILKALTINFEETIDLRTLEYDFTKTDEKSTHGIDFSRMSKINEENFLENPYFEFFSNPYTVYSFFEKTLNNYSHYKIYHDIFFRTSRLDVYNILLTKGVYNKMYDMCLYNSDFSDTLINNLRILEASLPYHYKDKSIDFIRKYNKMLFNEISEIRKQISSFIRKNDFKGFINYATSFSSSHENKELKKVFSNNKKLINLYNNFANRMRAYTSFSLKNLLNYFDKNELKLVLTEEYEGLFKTQSFDWDKEEFKSYILNSLKEYKKVNKRKSIRLFKAITNIVSLDDLNNLNFTTKQVEDICFEFSKRKLAIKDYKHESHFSSKIEQKCNPEFLIAGNASVCCMSFGDSKAITYAKEKGFGIFNVYYKDRIIANSVIWIHELYNCLVIDNIEVAPNYNKYENHDFIVKQYYKMIDYVTKEYNVDFVVQGRSYSDLKLDCYDSNSNCSFLLKIGSDITTTQFYSDANEFYILKYNKCNYDEIAQCIEYSSEILKLSAIEIENGFEIDKDSVSNKHLVDSLRRYVHLHSKEVLEGQVDMPF